MQLTLKERARRATDQAVGVGHDPEMFQVAWRQADGDAHEGDRNADLQSVVIRRTVSFYCAISAVVEDVHQKNDMMADIGNRKNVPMSLTNTAIAANVKPAEMQHAEAVAAYRAACAKEDWRVRDFRQRVIGGTLSAGDASLWLQSPAVRFLSSGTFNALAIPVANHIARYTVDCCAPAPSGMFIYDGESGYRRFSDDGEAVGDLFVTVCWDNGGVLTHRTIRGGRTTLTNLSDNQIYWFDSLRATLAITAEQIARDYGWTQDKAEWFILTADVPPMDVLRVDLQLHDITSSVAFGGVISQQIVTITAVPWLSQDTIKAAYAKAQSLLQMPRAIKGGERSYEVFRFVTDCDGTAMPTEWVRLHRAWKNDHSTKGQFADYRDFRNAYKSARASIQRTQRLYIDSHLDSQ